MTEIKKNGSELAIISTYFFPYVKKLGHFNKNDYDKICKIALSVMAADDFNAKQKFWGSRVKYKGGRLIYEHLPHYTQFNHTPVSPKIRM